MKWHLNTHLIYAILCGMAMLFCAPYTIADDASVTVNHRSSNILTFTFPVNDWVEHAKNSLLKVESVNKKGNVITAVPASLLGSNSKFGISEGWYYALSYSFSKEKKAKESTPILFSSAQVLSVDKNGQLRIRGSKELLRDLQLGNFLLLIRPPNTSTEDIQSLRSAVNIKQTGLEIILSPHDIQLYQTRTQLYRLSWAFLNYYDAHNHFPPAVVYGPEGKPWHSWRTLLLEYIPDVDAREMVSRYKFHEPWNSPHNIKLVSEIPNVYRSCFHKTGYTPYVVPVGRKAMFKHVDKPEPNPKDDIGEINLDGTKKSVTTLAEIESTTGCAIMVGMVGPERKIPWTQPVDMLIDEKFPPLNKEKSFYTPFWNKQKGTHFGCFCLANGRVTFIKKSITAELLGLLLDRTNEDTFYLITDYPDQWQLSTRNEGRATAKTIRLSIDNRENKPPVVTLHGLGHE